MPPDGTTAAAGRFSTPALYRRLLGQTRPYAAHLAGLLVLSLLLPCVRLLAPLPLKIIVDHVLAPHPLPAWLGGQPGGAALLLLAGGLIVLIGLLGQALGLAISLLRTYTGERLVLGFRALLFRHAQRLSLAYHDARGTTDSTYRIQYDAPCIQWIMVDGLIPFLAAAFTLAALIGVTAWVDWQLALVALGVCPVLFFLTQFFGPRLRRRSKELKQRESSALSVVQEVLAAVRVVKAFGQEEREQDRFVSHSSASLKARLRVAFAEGGFGLLVGLTTAAGTAAVLLLGVGHVQAGTLTLGDLLLVMAYVAQLYTPLETLSKKAADLQASLASADRVFALLDEGPDVVERPGAVPLPRARGEVEFRGVAFAYGPRQPALHDVSFRVPAGSRVGVLGKTGAGKTTLASLLTRLYDPAEGQVLLDGRDLRDYRLTDLRNQFAIVLQESVLFSTSIAENIAYARPGAGEAEVGAAAKAANAHEFIAALPAGYDTRVGERGMQLSGGERQRIALARAFLRGAPLLLLDEPTSSVDVKTEAAIMEATGRLMEGRTTFLIAHRLSTLAGCDLLLVLDRGRLVAVETDVEAAAARLTGAALQGSGARD